MDPLRNEPPHDRNPSDEELAEVGGRLRQAAELSVPVLLAPEDRMAEVRRRVRRNRRIRVAALASPVLALAAAASLLLPAGGPAGSGPAAGGLGAPSGSPAATDRPGLRTVSLAEGMPGLKVIALADWQVMLPRDPDGTPVPPGVYLSSEPAAPGKGGPCVGTLTSDEPMSGKRCLPVAELPPHRGVLVYWVRYSLPALKTSGTPQIQHVAPNDACRRIGGTTALTRTYTTPSGNAEALTAYACLAAPDDSLVNEVVAVLDSVRPVGSSH